MTPLTTFKVIVAVAAIGAVGYGGWNIYDRFQDRDRLAKANETIGLQNETITKQNTQITAVNTANRTLEAANERIAQDTQSLATDLDDLRSSIDRLRKQNASATRAIRDSGTPSPDYTIAQGELLVAMAEGGEKLSADGERIARAADQHVADINNLRAQWPKALTDIRANHLFFGAGEK